MPAVGLASKQTPHSARDRLLDVALELFSTHGYQAIGLRDLASELGLHAGSLYSHIENKQSLLFELIESALSDLLAGTKQRMRGARTRQDRLHRFIDAFVAFNLAHKHRLLLVAREFVHLSDDQKLEVDQLKNNYALLLRAIISAECDESSDLITEAVIGMLYGQFLWRNLSLSEQRLAETLTRFVTGIIASGKKSMLRA